MAQASTILDELYGVIASRKGTDPDKSYTAKLFSRGRGKIAQKFGEEAVETVVAALSEGKDQLVAESADTLYHLLVLWADCGVEPAKVWAELAHRAGTSGIDEKKSRAKK
jgi:phosphoribosyl-ATP pyrophosphohydrolase